MSILDRFRVVIPGDAPPWAQALEAELNAALVKVARAINPPFFTVAQLPTNGSIRLAIATDEAGGAVLVFFDGTNWRRVTDRAIAS